jgi:hypothetical protein
MTLFTTDAWGFASSLRDLVLYYRQYMRVMAHWHSVLPSNRLLDIEYENVVAEPELATRQLVAFCDVEWDSACIRPNENRDVVRTASHWQARQPIYRSSVERWRLYEPWIAELLELLY